jgi:flagellar hook-associated protein 3 FlgL
MSESFILQPNDRIFLERTSEQRARASLAIERLSSGKKFRVASDSPTDTVAILTARSSLSSNDQLVSNLSRLEIEVDAGEQSLAQSVKLIEKAVTVAVAGLSPSQNADTRASLALQIDSAIGDLVRQANTKVEGRYIFAGDSDQTRPYGFSAGALDPVSSYGGSNSTRLAEDPLGGSFRIGITAQEVFEAPGNDVFAALTGLRDALSSNDTSAIETQLSAVKTAGSFVNGQLAKYGSFQSQVRDAKAAAQERKLSLSQQLATLEDADVYAEASILSSANNNIEAAMSAKRLTSKGSLFDYLG